MKPISAGLLALLGSACVSVAADPSALEPANRESEDVRYGICIDIDEDGREDLILSDPRRLFGNGGGNWEIFLRDANDRLVSAGRIGAQVGFIRKENVPGVARLWIFWRSGWEGTLGYHEVKNGRVQPLVAVRIFPDDGGTEVSQGLLRAVFPEWFDAGIEEITTIDAAVEQRKSNPTDELP